MTSLSVPTAIYDALQMHLAPKDTEHAAFLFTEPTDDPSHLRVSDLYTVPPEGFAFQSGYHIELSDEIRGEVIKRAWNLGGSLIEAHSHLSGPAAFSKSDLYGFEEWVPHVRWRLANRPYIALVFAADSFDALVWQDAHGPAPLEHLHVDRRSSLAPTSLTLKKIRQAQR